MQVTSRIMCQMQMVNDNERFQLNLKHHTYVSGELYYTVEVHDADQHYTVTFTEAQLGEARVYFGEKQAEWFARCTSMMQQCQQSQQPVDFQHVLCNEDGVMDPEVFADVPF